MTKYIESKTSTTEPLEIQKMVIAETVPVIESKNKPVTKKVLVGIYLDPTIIKQVKKISYETETKANDVYTRAIKNGLGIQND